VPELSRSIALKAVRSTVTSFLCAELRVKMASPAVVSRGNRRGSVKDRLTQRWTEQAKVLDTNEEKQRTDVLRIRGIDARTQTILETIERAAWNRIRFCRDLQVQRHDRCSWRILFHNELSLLLVHESCWCVWVGEHHTGAGAPTASDRINSTAAVGWARGRPGMTGKCGREAPARR